MAQTFRDFAKTRLSALTNVGSLTVAPTTVSAPPAGQLLMTGAQIKDLTAELEKGLLDQNAQLTYSSLDALTHLLEMQVERTRDRNQPLSSVTWQSGVVRLVAARSQHAALRIPGFAERLDHDGVVPLSLAGRLLGVLSTFSDLTAQEMMGETRPPTPEDWLTIPPELVGVRNNLGVAYYHMSRLLEIGAHADPTTLAARDATFAANFDIMFYAFIYGPLMGEAQSNKMVQMLQDHLAQAESYLSAPQPALRDNPERFTVSATHVAHIISTVDRVRTVLARLSG